MQLLAIVDVQLIVVIALAAFTALIFFSTFYLPAVDIQFVVDVQQFVDIALALFTAGVFGATLYLARGARKQIDVTKEAVEMSKLPYVVL